MLKITMPKRPEAVKAEKRNEIGKPAGDGGDQAAGNGSRGQQPLQQEARH